MPGQIIPFNYAQYAMVSAYVEISKTTYIVGIGQFKCDSIKIDPIPYTSTKRKKTYNGPGITHKSSFWILRAKDSKAKPKLYIPSTRSTWLVSST